MRTARSLAALGAATLLCLSGTEASATTYIYNLYDHSGRSISGQEYGIRLDSQNKFFSFEQQTADPNDTGLSLARLIYNDSPTSGAPSAVITGEVRDNDDNSLWTISYALTNVDDKGGGLFSVSASSTPPSESCSTSSDTDLGCGTITSADGNTVIDINGKTQPSLIFDLLTGHRGETGISGLGWLYAEGEGPASGEYNDFLFVAVDQTLDAVTPIPLPAPVLMLLSSLVGLAWLGRRRSAEDPVV